MSAAPASGATPPSLLGDLVVRPHHTAVCVEDFDAAQDFFCDILGMRVEGAMARRDEAGLSAVVGLPGAAARWAMLERDGYRIELFKYFQPEGVTVNIRQCDRGITHVAFQVTDADAAYEKIIAAGFDTYSPPIDLRGGASRPFYIKGPEGIVVELIEIRSLTTKHPKAAGSSSPGAQAVLARPVPLCYASGAHACFCSTSTPNAPPRRRPASAMMFPRIVAT